MISYSSIEEAASKGNFIIHSHGVSMWPMIRNGKDSVRIEPVEGRLNKFDLPLYKDNRGRYVIHRVIEVTEDGYVICGDGLCEKEYDITDKNILGRVEGFFRKEKYVSCQSKGYRLYVRLWAGTFMFMRTPLIKIVRLCRHTKNRIKKLFVRIFCGKKNNATKQSEK